MSLIKEDGSLIHMNYIYSFGNKSKINYVVHLAAIVGVSNVNKSPYETLQNNLVTLLNVINYVKKMKSNSKIIFFSSSEVYSSLIESKKIRFPISEDNQILIPNNLIIIM